MNASTVPDFYLPLAAPRGALLRTIRKQRQFHLIIAGGGVNGAAVAWLAAFNGLMPLLLEAGEYGAHYSGIASANWWLDALCPSPRPLEILRRRSALRDFRVVAGRHLKPLDIDRANCRASQFFCLPEYLISRLGPPLSTDRRVLHDFQINEALLAQEMILAARQEGAHCLNYAKVEAINVEKDGTVEVLWRDGLTGDVYHSRTGALLNCTGPDVPILGRLSAAPFQSSIRAFRHLQMLFPTTAAPEHARVFFSADAQRLVLLNPAPSGVIADVVFPSGRQSVPAARIEGEVLSRDLAKAGLITKAAAPLWSFGRVWTLPQSKPARSPRFEGSSDYSWVYHAGRLNLIGGGVQTVRSAAWHGLRLVMKLAGLHRPITPLGPRLLSGEQRGPIEEFRSDARRRGIPDAVIEHTVTRMGSHVRFFENKDKRFQLCGPGVLFGELEFLVAVSQATNARDIIFGRLEGRAAGPEALSLVAPVTEVLREAGLAADEEAAMEESRRVVGSF